MFRLLEEIQGRYSQLFHSLIRYIIHKRPERWISPQTLLQDCQVEIAVEGRYFVGMPTAKREWVKVGWRKIPKPQANLGNKCHRILPDSFGLQPHPEDPVFGYIRHRCPFKEPRHSRLLDNRRKFEWIATSLPTWWSSKKFVSESWNVIDPQYGVKDSPISARLHCISKYNHTERSVTPRSNNERMQPTRTRIKVNHQESQRLTLVIVRFTALTPSTSGRKGAIRHWYTQISFWSIATSKRHVQRRRIIHLHIGPDPRNYPLRKWTKQI